MHVDNNVLSILFHITLFSLLFYQLWRLGKTHIVPFLLQRIKTHRKQQAELLDKEKLLAATLKRMDIQIGVQKKTLVSLEKKVQTWYQALLKNKQQEERSKQEIFEHIEEKRALQEKHLANSKIAEITLPEVFNVTQQKLATRFAGEDGATELKKLIFTLNSRAKI